MSKGLVEAAKGNWDDGLFYLGVIAANAGVAYLAAAVVARDLYRSAYSRVQGERSSKRRVGGYGLDNLFHRVFGFLPRPIRLLILKDLRTFRRDPTQWSQFLIFFGLLAPLLRQHPPDRLRHPEPVLAEPDQLPESRRDRADSLDLHDPVHLSRCSRSRAGTSGCSVSCRSRDRPILWGKFAFATGISLVSTEGLVILGDLMLRLSPMMIVLHMGMVLILCLGLSGISVGLGARLPNLKEDDPSRIASGFGGTLNLLVSLCYIFAIVMAVAVPCFFYFKAQDEAGGIGFVLNEGQFRVWMSVAIGAVLVVGAIGTIVPLRMGIRAFRRMEF